MTMRTHDAEMRSWKLLFAVGWLVSCSAAPPEGDAATDDDDSADGAADDSSVEDDDSLDPDGTGGSGDQTATGGQGSVGPECSISPIGDCSGLVLGLKECTGPDSMSQVFSDGVEYGCIPTEESYNCLEAAIASADRCARLADAGTGGSGSGGSTGSGGSATVCDDTFCEDVDRDGYSDADSCIKSCSFPGGTYRKDFGYGKDCYDASAEAHPSLPAGSYFSEDRGDGSFDYNCDGKETPEFSLGSCLKLNIPDAKGWQGTVPACGESGTFIDFDFNGNCKVAADTIARCR